MSTTRLGVGGYPVAGSLPSREAGANQAIPAFTQSVAIGVLVDVAAEETVPAFSQVVAATVIAAIDVAQTIPAFSQNAEVDTFVGIAFRQTIPAFAQDFEAVNLAPPPAPEEPAPHGVIGTPFRPGPIHSLFASIDGVLPPITGAGIGFIPLVEGTGAGALRRSLFVADPEMAGDGVGVMRGFLGEGRGDGVIRQFGAGQGRLGMIGGSAKGTVELLTEEEMLAIILALAA